MSTATDLSHEREAEIVGRVPRHLFVDGKWNETLNHFRVEDPATGRVLASVADADVDDGLRAVEAASRVQSDWGRSSPRTRSDLLRRAYDRMTADTEDLALLITLEMGKPLAEARAEVTYAAEFFRWYSEEVERVSGEYRVAPNGTNRILTMRQPVGPCLLVTPWNFPLAMAARKIAAALAAGCTVVLKPAPQTPLSSLALARILEECEIPSGVVNVVTTTRAAAVVSAMLQDKRIRKLSFTGSTAVGQQLAAQSSAQLLRVSMELGGNAPFIVLADADVDAAVDGAVQAKLRNGGEACTAANRFLVDRQVADAFTEKLAARFARLVVGRGTDAGVDIGPLIDEGARQKVSSMVAEAVNAGADLVSQATVSTETGYFFPPTVLRVDHQPAARLLHEEIFGPVAPIVVFDEVDDLIVSANSTEYGLVAYVYTRDLPTALRVTEGLETGMVGINCGVVSNAAAPFGGVKHSGYGREGGREGIDDYLALKYAAIAV